MKLWLLILLVVFSASAQEVVVGSKKFTESVILAEILRQLSAASGAQIRHQAELGGTAILWNALKSGDIDLYPEYTGTLNEMLLPGGGDLAARLAKDKVLMSEPLGFNDSYAIGVQRETAQRLSLATLSDLAKHPELKLGFSAEFLQRADGWPKVRKQYGFSSAPPVGLDHDIAYRALQNGDIDALDLYTTDAEIHYYDLVILADDRGVFPRYDALVVYRQDLAERSPSTLGALRRLRGKIDEAEMIRLNEKVKIERRPAEQVAADFLREKFGLQSSERRQSLVERVCARAREHLRLVASSMLAALLVGLTFGMLSASFPSFGTVVLAIVGVIQTFPALALLVILIRPLKSLGLSGIGDTPAIVALFLYSLLPIVRNTHAGLRGISTSVHESMEALALPFATRWLRIKLPLALPVILAGVQTAAVTNVGFATLGALVGAGGFGQPILSGIRLDDYSLILEGALPAAGLAILTQVFFELLERALAKR